MRWIKEKPIILIPLMLIAAFFLLPLLHEEKGNRTRQVSEAKEEFPATGFADYDLLPVELKKQMEELVQVDTMHRYIFYYFFKVDDINQHYYLEDNPENTIVNFMPVKNQAIFELVEEKLIKDDGKGYAVSIDERLYLQRETAHKGIVSYVLPEDKAHTDFTKLRVGIMKWYFPNYSPQPHELPQDNRTYELSEVDQPPVPIRGMEYFKKAVMDDIRSKASFLYHDLMGEVVVEFTIGKKARSPQFAKDFAENTYESYRAGGIILRAINDSKVHWKPAQRKGKPVSVRLSVTFSFDKKGQETLLSMSDLYPATKLF